MRKLFKIAAITSAGIVGLGTAAVAQQPTAPAAQPVNHQIMGQQGQMGGMMGMMSMMNDPKMRQQMTQMMDNCNRMMSMMGNMQDMKQKSRS